MTSKVSTPEVPAYSVTGTRPVRVLSIQSRTMGHATYGELMRSHFSPQPDAASRSPIEFDFHWSDEDRDLWSKIDIRLGEQKLPGSWARRNNIDFGRYRTEIAYARRGARLATHLLSQHPADVLHFHTQVPALAALRLIRRMPVVITADITAALVAREATDPQFQWTHNPSIAVEKQIFAASSRVVFWSKWALNSFVNDLGLPPDKGAVVPPGVDLAAFPAQQWIEERTMTHAQEAKRPVRLLFVGNDFQRKGGYDLLAAFKQAKLAGRAELHIVTAADIPSEPPHIQVYSGVKAFSPQWFRLYQEADVFTFPSHYEGMPMALLEASAAGLPVISTQVNGIPEGVEEGESGFLIRAGDKEALADRMERLVQNAELRRSMGEKARYIAESRFDRTKNFDRLGAIFLEAAENYS